MTRVERYERRSEIPMLLLAAAFLIAYAWPVLDTSLDPDLRTSLTVLSWAVWVAFEVDFALPCGSPKTAGRTRVGTGTTSPWSCSPCSGHYGCSGCSRWPACSTGQ